MTQHNTIAFLFPGQGAQYPGMAKDFAENFSIARQTFEEADDLLGRNLSKIIFEGPENILTETKNSQTAIYIASVAMLRVLQQLLPNFKPQICAGLSLGEYTALHASGRLSFAETLKLVQLRGEFMNDACETTQGTMSVILGLSAEDVEAMVRDLHLPHDLWAANFNCPGQVVISGTQKGIAAATQAAKERGAKRVLPLQVHGAFHSGLMARAQDRLKEHVLQAPLQQSKVEFVMNVPGDFVNDPEEIKTNLIEQVTHSVKWEQGMRQMASRGVNIAVEVGPGKTLAPFVKRTSPEITTLSLEKSAELAAIEKAAANIG